MDRSPQCHASATRDVFAVCVTYALCRRIGRGDRRPDRRVRRSELNRVAAADGNVEVDDGRGVDGRGNARRLGAFRASA